MSWLGNGFREEAKALADAYAQMYAPRTEGDVDLGDVEEPAQEKQEELSEGNKIATDKSNTRHLNPNVKAKPSMDPDSNLNVKEENIEEGKERCWDGYKPAKGKKPFAKGSCVKEEEILSALEDAYAMMYEKKKDSDKCGDGTYWDKEEKKCKSKKKKSGTTVVVGRGGIYGPGYHGGGGGSNGGSDGDGGDTDGGDGGGDGGGGGGE